MVKEHSYLYSSGLLETLVCKAINQVSFLWGPQLEVNEAANFGNSLFLQRPIQLIAEGMETMRVGVGGLPVLLDPTDTRAALIFP